MALVKMAGGVEESGLEFPVADLSEMSAVTASCSCTAAGLEIEKLRVSNVHAREHEYVY